MEKNAFEFPYVWKDGNAAYDLGLYTEEDFSETAPERRCGIERRRFTYAAHIPERRKGMDRRKNRMVGL